MTENWSVDAARVRDNLLRIEEEIQNACAAAGRRREEVTLMAVTKTVAPELINVALDSGIRCIGENRVQEYLGKRDALHLDGVTRCLIGHLQTNKVRQIVGEVDRIESVDSVKLAKAISDMSLKRTGNPTDVLVEINIGNEESKSGILAETLDEFLGEIAQFEGIRVRGLMAIPPILTEDSEKRAIFSQMRKLFIDISGKIVDNVSMDILSMGMSSDYVQAVLEGSTQVRVGSAIFGERHY
jgi:pyridoxal phosphate enzyme (YggS family)